MSETMVHEIISVNCCGELENAIRSRFIEACSTEDYINDMQDITTRNKIGRNWYKPPIDNKTGRKPISRKNEPQDKAPLKFHKCGSTFNLANTCPKRTRINEIPIGKAEDTKETDDVSAHESDSEPSEEEELPDQLSIENIKKKEITFIREVRNINEEKFVSDQLIESKIGPESTLELKEDLIKILFQYREAFSSDNEPLAAIKVHEVEISYPSLLRRPAYPASPRAREALEAHINELLKLGVLRKVGHNEEVEGTTPVIITWHNDK
ncbi:hypothetical protein O181_010998 [Austropuccinia psidii MF-1]|uniref:Uncharacterized protein n=1 Tax=Austropuccinia psidii MF-1 TaxID=1389203 RepID=A0A9Q3BUF4_9BASI|nr:hypothetical protein [Austropuccinia psidii MF-1]